MSPVTPTPSTRPSVDPIAAGFRDLLGIDAQMQVVFDAVRTAATSDIATLVLGPTGSGKEAVARAIHELGSRSAGPFQAINCAGLPDALFESEMFGHEKGAFTGAHERKPGRLELADGGTLLLDEIGDLSAGAQAKLLRALEQRRFERLGAATSTAVDFRVISASNRPLDRLVLEGTFREDLFYRVNAFVIHLPALSERPADIPVLAQRFVARHCLRQGLPSAAKELSREAIARLQSYAWPGNIRELDSTVTRAALCAQGVVIRESDIQFLHPAGDNAIAARLPTLRETERAHVLRALIAANWNKREAARILDVSRGTLYRKIAEYGLTAPSRA